ncbi:hypothetical protein BC937DRAFT_93600 [Endogone sp. FLAS-F59071]|nr:hypothetical protein BC937DRAFT_93600 [Endogone sp. FLAS-F59071]|eukprot:RUS23014.1 hypothetical protein BC937DRAFT_93600 [Endogone sp. FLAS-F59071]
MLFKTLVSVALIALCSVSVQGQSSAPNTCKGGVNPNGAKDGDAIIKASAKIKDGLYTLQNVKSGSFLSFVSTGNIISPAKRHTQINTYNQWTTWTLRTHPKSNYVSIRMVNDVGHEKCASTRWITNGSDGGCDDAAVMWQCEVDNTKTKRDLNSTLTFQDEEDDFDYEDLIPDVHEEVEVPSEDGRNLTKRYVPVRHDKQLWVLQKVGSRHSNEFKIYSLAHLWDMVPRCLSTTPGWRGTLLADCYVNTGSTSLYWKMTRRGHK